MATISLGPSPALRATFFKVLIALVLCMGRAAAMEVLDLSQETLRGQPMGGDAQSSPFAGDDVFVASGDGVHGMVWVCLGNTIEQGLCENTIVRNAQPRGPYPSQIRVLMTEQNSRVQKEIVVYAHALNFGEAPTEYMTINNTYTGPEMAATTVRQRIIGFQIYYVGMVLHGGVWTGTIRLRARRGDNTAWVPRADILLNVRVAVDDENNAQVFFMDEKTSSITTDIALSPAGSDLLAGSSGKDICLYDGFAMHAQKYELTTTGRHVPGMGRHLRLAQHSDSLAGRLPYRVMLTTKGRTVELIDTPIILNQSDMDFRTVVMPGVSDDRVYCGSARLTLAIDPFDPMQKYPGLYRDELQLIFKRASSTL